MKRALVLILFFLVVLTAFLPADDVIPQDDIRMADIPIFYGEESFRARILERTKGERDPIGLVLTGGSARAFAHLGVLQYLEEIGVEPDFIVTNSMGSIIGMLYAAGLSPAQIMNVVNSGELSTFFKLSIPRDGGIIDASAFRGLIQSIVGKDLQIEDLAIPCMVIAQDMVTKREIRISEGDFAEVMIASFAIPAYFPPQEYRGHLLIDGGAINLAPIGIAFDYSDTVIVSTSFYDNPELNLKNMLTIINVGFDIGKRRRAAEDIRKFGDRMIWIRCGVEQFSFMDFSAAGEMMKIGYEDAKSESESLDKLYKSGIDPEILERREELEAKIERAAKNQYFFNRIETQKPFSTWTLGFESFQDSPVPYYLNDNVDFGVDYAMRYMTIETGFKLGFRYDTTDLDEGDGGVLGSGYGYFFLKPNMRVSAYGSAVVNTVGTTFYMRQGYDYKFLNRPRSSFEFNQSIESSFNSSDDVNRFEGWLLFGQFAGHRDFGVFDLKLDLGYIGLKPYNSEPYRNYLQFGAFSRIYPKNDSGLYVDFGLRGRHALDDDEFMPLFKADEFITGEDAMASGMLVSSDTDILYIVPTSVGYDFPGSVSSGEFILFEDLETSVFVDFLFTDDVEASYGLELQATPSLIGLQKVPMTLRFGYDSISGGLFGSLRFTVTK